MNPRLALTTTLAIALLFVLSSTALAQNSNCAYTFTYTKNAFSFCISQYGTLGMLQAPIGVNLIDPNAPIEGYVYYFDIEGNDNFLAAAKSQTFPIPAIASPKPRLSVSRMALGPSRSLQKTVSRQRLSPRIHHKGR